MRDFHIRPYEPSDEGNIRQWFDNTRLTALHGCNFWGMIRYINSKAMHEPERQLPLECGHAIHEALAIAMCTKLIGTMAGEAGYERAEAIINNENRWLSMEEYDVGGEPLIRAVERGDAKKAALTTLYSSTYYDDPSDSKRTIANMEISLLFALEQLDHYVPLVLDGQVMVEMPVKFVIEYRDNVYVYNGRADMARQFDKGIGIVDFKTSSGLSGEWARQWDTSHQMTGYCAGMALQLGHPINRGSVVGIQIPLPRDAFKGVQIVPFQRYEHQFESWINYTLDGIDTYERFVKDPFSATKRTDYCFRYFRMCQFTPMCSAHPDDVDDYIEQLVTAEWNPEDE